MERIIERYDSVEMSRYPFKPGPDIVASAPGLDAWVFEPGAVLHASFDAVATGPGSASLTGVSVASGSLTLLFDVGGFMLTATVPRPVENYADLVFETVEAGVRLVVGSKLEDSVATVDPGVYSIEGGAFEGTLVMCHGGRAVRRIKSPDGEWVSGHVELVEGYNTRVGTYPASGRVTIGVGHGFGVGEPCERLHEPGVGVDCEDVILAINDAEPDWFGNLDIVGGGGVEIASDAGSHKIILRTPYKKCEPGCEET